MREERKAANSRESIFFSLPSFSCWEWNGGFGILGPSESQRFLAVEEEGIWSGRDSYLNFLVCFWQFLVFVLFFQRVNPFCLTLNTFSNFFLSLF